MQSLFVLLLNCFLLLFSYGLAQNCPSLPPTDYGKFDKCADGNSCKQGSKATLTCDKGFQVSGSPTVLCSKVDSIPLIGIINKNQPVATWSPVLSPTCIPDERHCTPLGELKNGRQDNCTSSACLQNTTVSFSCEDGYRLCGAAAISCTKTSASQSSWSASQPTCVKGECGFGGLDFGSLNNLFSALFG